MAVSLVHFHDFDVFGIKEGLIHQVKDLVKDGTYTFVGVESDDGKEAGEHAAVLFKKDRFKLLDSEITGCRRHRISLLLAGMRNAGGFVLGRS